jgi:hypothetical protein
MKFYLDGNEVQPAVNWKDIDVSLKKDKNLNIFLLFQDFELQFDADGYDYLSNIIYDGLFCNEVDVRIDKFCNGEYVVMFQGKLIIADCEVDEQACIVSAKVQDKSFFYTINNNKNIKTSFNGLYTKNKEAITSTEIYELDVRDVSTLAVTRTVESCRVEEAFRYFVDFMTDNSVSFVSDTFGSGGEWAGLCITTGERLRGVTPSVTDARWITTSFLELFTEVNRRIPLVLLIDNPYTNPVVRIESAEYLYNANTSLILQDIDAITTSFDNQKLYALVKFGSPTDLVNQIDFPEYIDFYGYKDEEFHILGKCNLDQTLDLTCQWVSSSNVIQLVVDTLITDWDSNLFIINSIYTDDFTGTTTNDNFIGSVPPFYHYNYLLNNENISTRYIDDLADSIAAFYIDSVQGQAYAYTSLNLQHTVFVNNENFTGFLNTESYDYGNNFDTALGRYTAPQKAAYTIKAAVTLQFGAQTGTGFNWYQFHLEHYDASNTLLATYDIAAPNNIIGSGNIPGSYWVASYSPGTDITKTLNNQVINMNANDYVTMRIRSYPDGVPTIGTVNGGALYNILNNASQTFLQIVDTSFIGGIFNNVDPNNLNVQLHKFDYPLTYGEWTSIINNPVAKIGFGMKNRPYRYGWIEEIKYNHASSTASFILSTSKNKQNVN